MFCRPIVYFVFLRVNFYVSVNFLPYQAIRTVETSDFLINLIFQGRSSDHFESVQSVVSAASSKIEERYSSGLILFIIAHLNHRTRNFFLIKHTDELNVLRLNYLNRFQGNQDSS